MNIDTLIWWQRHCSFLRCIFISFTRTNSQRSFIFNLIKLILIKIFIIGTNVILIRKKHIWFIFVLIFRKFIKHIFSKTSCQSTKCRRFRRRTIIFALNCFKIWRIRSLVELRVICVVFFDYGIGWRCFLVLKVVANHLDTLTFKRLSFRLQRLLFFLLDYFWRWLSLFILQSTCMFFFVHHYSNLFILVELIFNVIQAIDMFFLQQFYFLWKSIKLGFKLLINWVNIFLIEILILLYPTLACSSLKFSWFGDYRSQLVVCVFIGKSSTNWSTILFWLIFKFQIQMFRRFWSIATFKWQVVIIIIKWLLDNQSRIDSTANVWIGTWVIT